MNTLGNMKHTKAFVAHFNDDVHDDSNAAGQDATDDLVAHVLDISSVNDATAVENGGTHEDDQDDLKIFFHNSPQLCCHTTYPHTSYSVNFMPDSP